MTNTPCEAPWACYVSDMAPQKSQCIIIITFTMWLWSDKGEMTERNEQREKDGQTEEKKNEPGREKERQKAEKVKYNACSAKVKYNACSAKVKYNACSAKVKHNACSAKVKYKAFPCQPVQKWPRPHCSFLPAPLRHPPPAPRPGCPQCCRRDLASPSRQIGVG